MQKQWNKIKDDIITKLKCQKSSSSEIFDTTENCSEYYNNSMNEVLVPETMLSAWLEGACTYMSNLDKNAIFADKVS